MSAPTLLADRLAVARMYWTDGDTRECCRRLAEQEERFVECFPNVAHTVAAVRRVVERAATDFDDVEAAEAGVAKAFAELIAWANTSAMRDLTTTGPYAPTEN